MTVAGGLVLALLSTLALNWSWVVQHRAASALPPLSLRRPIRSLRSLFSDRRWVLGFVTGLAGWALYIAALALTPISLVQGISAGGIGLLALLASRGGERLERREWAAVAISLAGLVLLAGSLAGGVAHGRTPSLAAVGLWLACSLGAAVALAGPGAGLLAGGAGFGLAAGTLYAAGDVATKAAVGGRWVLVAAVLAAHGGAFVALQLGFQRGGALVTAGLNTLATNALPIVAGLLLFEERFPGGVPGVLRGVALAAAVLGAALLARGEPGPAEISPSRGRGRRAAPSPPSPAATSSSVRAVASAPAPAVPGSPSHRR